MAGEAAITSSRSCNHEKRSFFIITIIDMIYIIPHATAAMYMVGRLSRLESLVVLSWLVDSPPPSVVRCCSAPCDLRYWRHGWWTLVLPRRRVAVCGLDAATSRVSANQEPGSYLYTDDMRNKLHVCIYVCLSIRPSVHPSVHPSIHPFIHSSLHPPIPPSLHHSIPPYERPSLRPCVRPSVRSSIHRSIGRSIYLTIHLSVQAECVCTHACSIHTYMHTCVHTHSRSASTQTVAIVGGQVMHSETAVSQDILCPYIPASGPSKHA